MTNVQRAILTGTAVSGTLDILSAFVFGGIAGQTPGMVLRSVASGPFGNGMAQAGVGGAAAGLVVHYAIMSVMVTAFVFAAQRIVFLLDHPIVSGVIYGAALYLFMYWGVLHFRFGITPKLDPYHLGNALFSHCILVGIPMALIARAMLKGR